MRTEDLYLKYAQVINMCEGTKVKPWEGVRHSETKKLHKEHTHPEFFLHPENYEFMVAVLEDRPVFVGDKVYGAVSGDTFIAESGGYRSKHNELIVYMCDHFKFAWNPPKTTFNLNGKELPCPDKSNRFELKIVGFGENNYHFNNVLDIRKVEYAINKLLQDATK